MKRLLLTFRSIVAPALCGLAVGCKPQPTITANEPSASVIRTDVEPVMRRLPKLGKLDKVWWTATKVTISSVLSPPENPAYQFQGFVKLESKVAADLTTRYDWEKMPANWRPQLSIPAVNVGHDWCKNSLFTKDYKFQYIPGDLYFERTAGFVFFDLEIE